MRKGKDREWAHHCTSKKERPPKGRALLKDSRVAGSAMRVIGRDAVDIGSSDADVREFAVAQMRKLPPDFAIAFPLVEEAGKGCKHFSNPFPGGSPAIAGIMGPDIGGRVQRTIDFAAVQLRPTCMPDH